MEKKDKIISEKLEQYFDQAPPEHLKQAAVNLLHIKAAKKEEQRRKRGALTAKILAIALPTAATFLAVIVGFSLLIDNLFGGINSNDIVPAKTQYYSSSELGRSSASIDQVNQNTDNSLDQLPEYYVKSIYSYYFKQTNEVAFYEVNLRIQTQRGFEEVRVFVELTDKVYNNFKGYYDLAEYSEGVRGTQTYENGEYICYAALMREQQKYYLYIMSPSSGAIDDYAALLQK